ncbi:hypothetical protein BKA70DRAFT_1107162 [Coprinopsis sp. MPI-PUGE-AT-0042]|nr:hypothetical protein BKA70DRAFT_1107162 [Coprinopsis sp. MPI-PUGE-AT-0042]
MSLSSDLSWPDFFAQVKVLACDVLFPGKANVGDNAISLTFTIARCVSATMLSNDEEYDYMVESALKIKEPAVKVVVSKVVFDDPEVNTKLLLTSAGPHNRPIELRQQYTYPTPFIQQNDPDEEPGNKAMNEKIKALRERYICNTRGCSSNHCFVTPTGEHLALTHVHMERWAAGILSGPETATLDAPPNIIMFDPSASKAAKSPILQARLDAINRERNGEPAQPAAPVIHVHIPAMGANLPNPLPAAAGNQALGTHTTTGPLIPPTHICGPVMTISDFCMAYALSSNIYQRFEEHGFTGTHAFAHLEKSELIQDLGFRKGEAIDIIVAVET